MASSASSPQYNSFLSSHSALYLPNSDSNDLPLASAEDPSLTQEPHEAHSQLPHDAALSKPPRREITSYSTVLPPSPENPHPDDPHFLTPKLTGKWPVGVKSFYADPEKRLLVDVHYPAVQTKAPAYRILPLSPPKHPMNTDGIEDSAKREQLENLWTRSQPGLDIAEGKFPVVIFSHGMGSNHFDYACLLEELASQGYYIFSISHPSSNGLSDLAKISYPDPPPTLDQVSPAIYTQANETLLLIDQIRSSAFQDKLGDNIDIDRIGVMGHSLGGDSALQACRQSYLIRTGIDLDGGSLKHIEQVGILQPFLSIGAGRQGTYGEPFEESGELWDGNKEWNQYKETSPLAEKVVLPNVDHNDFSITPLFQEIKTDSDGLADLKKVEDSRETLEKPAEAAEEKPPKANPRDTHKTVCELITNWFNTKLH